MSSISPRSAASLGSQMVLPAKNFAPNTKEYVASFNDLLTNVQQLTTGRKRSTSMEAIIQSVWENSEKLRGSVVDIVNFDPKKSSMNFASRLQLVENDVELRLEIDKGVSDLLKVLKTKNLGQGQETVLLEIKKFKKLNKEAIYEDTMFINVLRFLPRPHMLRKDVKTNAAHLLKNLIRNAYGYESKNFTLQNSLGKFWGIDSSENRILFNMLVRDYSKASANTIDTDAKQAMELIEKGFTQAKTPIPEHLHNEIRDLKMQLRKVQKPSKIVGAGLKEKTCLTRYKELMDAITDFKLTKMKPEEARTVVLAIVKPTLKQWPSTYNAVDNLASLCKQASSEINDEDFEKLLDRSGIFFPGALRNELWLLITEAYGYEGKEFKVEKSLGKYRGVRSADNTLLRQIRNDTAKLTDVSIVELRQQARNAVQLIEKAFAQKGHTVPEQLRQRLNSVIEMSERI